MKSISYRIAGMLTMSLAVSIQCSFASDEPLQQGHFKAVGEVQQGTAITRSRYQVKLPILTGQLKTFPYQEFQDVNAEQNIMVNVGLGPGFSYAASVQVADKLAENQDVLSYAKSHAPNIKFTAIEMKASDLSCVESELYSPRMSAPRVYSASITVYNSFFVFIGICADHRDHQIYRVIFSERTSISDKPEADFAQAADSFIRSFDLH